MGDPIYLDYNGTTPVDPEVLDAMLPFLRGEFGNPSSATPLGARAKAAIERARGEVAALIGADSFEVVFTSGGTEASNQAIFGFAGCAPSSRRKIVSSTVEHPATEMPLRRLAEQTFSVVRAPVARNGIVDVVEAAAEIDASTELVTIIHAQNETGVLQPVAELSAAAARAGAPIHVDASQSLGKVHVDVRAWGIDALTIAGHKLYAPKGIGALFVRRGHELPSPLAGAGQEYGRRPGTENVAYIAGLGRACGIAARRLREDARTIGGLRDALWKGLSSGIAGLVRVGDGAASLPNTLNVLLPGVAGHEALAATPRIAAATGSACHAGATMPSAIILAHGFAPHVAAGAIRLTLGRGTTSADIEGATAALVATWERLRH